MQKHGVIIANHNVSHQRKKVNKMPTSSNRDGLFLSISRDDKYPLVILCLSLDTSQALLGLSNRVDRIFITVVAAAPAAPTTAPTASTSTAATRTGSLLVSLICIFLGSKGFCSIETLVCFITTIIHISYLIISVVLLRCLYIKASIDFFFNCIPIIRRASTKNVLNVYILMFFNFIILRAW
ncbi:hypothetical protein OIU74_022409 [Salix koriyanagi]|uniref:Uncharacterized protein n=1 Tax=Salix koriyanagi TaxID=2511006 RepID=A0A9Q0WK45_9ROSI|nr:hypothetical protein OIU74_022409 [Salix koriyanagi]